MPPRTQVLCVSGIKSTGRLQASYRCPFGISAQSQYDELSRERVTSTKKGVSGESHGNYLESI